MWTELREPVRGEGSWKVLLPLCLRGKRRKVISQNPMGAEIRAEELLAGTRVVEGLGLGR